MINKFAQLSSQLAHFNKSHPGAASGEAGAASAVGAVGAMGLLGKLTGLPLLRYGAVGAGAYAAEEGARHFTDPLSPTIGGIPRLPGPTDVYNLIKGLITGHRPGFSEGGIVPINAHAGEMVLPRSISAGLQGLFSGGGNGFGDTLRSWLTGSSGFVPFVRIMGGIAVAPASAATEVPGASTGGGGGRGSTGGGNIDGLVPKSGGDESAIRDTIRQAGEKLGMNPGQIRMASAAFLSAFAYESNLRHGVTRPHGTDTGWAQWVSTRLTHMKGYGDPHSLAANEKQLYYELTGPYKKLFEGAANSSNPMAAAHYSDMFETGGGSFAPGVHAGHMRLANAYYRKLGTDGGGTGDRHVTVHQTNNNTFHTTSDALGRVADASNRASSLITRNAKRLLN